MKMYGVLPVSGVVRDATVYTHCSCAMAAPHMQRTWPSDTVSTLLTKTSLLASTFHCSFFVTVVSLCTQTCSGFFFWLMNSFFCLLRQGFVAGS